MLTLNEGTGKPIIGHLNTHFKAKFFFLNLSLMDLRNCSSLLSSNYMDRVSLYFAYVMKKQMLKIFLFI